MWANKLVARMAQQKQLKNVVTDAGATGVAAYVTIDRDTASRMSITAALSIDDALYSAYGQRIVSTIFTETNQYRVILEAQANGENSIAGLGNLQLKTGSGKATPLSAVATVIWKSRRRCRSPTWRSTRPRRSASTPRPARRWAGRSIRSAPRPRTSRCRRRSR